MIEVKLYAYLPNISKSRCRELKIPPQEGLTVQDILVREQLPLQIARVVMVNGRRVEMDYLLKDGDEMAVFPPVAGG
ncbi:MoaD/ThiS family protein [Candidatus Hakubella thermalkaliphila]|uniref:Sulfur-carrier protein n=1 Tax=Candidatus Hakubella thermalkaliphila TaxID=2754717 RepID=A0A6V8PA53_9ACTN|nr:MoaD/ThiS family protein [Candidatus Hakubella thermalkaliphila]GFP27811.1 hypothetical protein HKBW3S33_01221 [Candidatus Hakubella thermalkaliphila]